MSMLPDTGLRIANLIGLNVLLDRCNLKVHVTYREKPTQVPIKRSPSPKCCHSLSHVLTAVPSVQPAASPTDTPTASTSSPTSQPTACNSDFPCENHGTCMDGLCVCVYEFVGSRCEIFSKFDALLHVQC